MNKEEVETEKRGIETKFKNRIETVTKNLFKKRDTMKRNQVSNAIILHLDGDKKYTQKSERYYNKLGLKAIVRNVPENRQPQVIRKLD